MSLLEVSGLNSYEYWAVAARLVDDVIFKRVAGAHRLAELGSVDDHEKHHARSLGRGISRSARTPAVCPCLRSSAFPA
jgi:hypothetical protein